MVFYGRTYGSQFLASFGPAQLGKFRYLQHLVMHPLYDTSDNTHQESRDVKTSRVFDPSSQKTTLGSGYHWVPKDVSLGLLNFRS